MLIYLKFCIEMRRKIYENKPSINFAYGNDVLFNIIRNKITDAEIINQKLRIKIDEKYAKLFSDEMKKFFPDKSETEIIPN